MLIEGLSLNGRGEKENQKINYVGRPKEEVSEAKNWSRRLVKAETDRTEDIATGKEFQRVQVEGRKEERLEEEEQKGTWEEWEDRKA